MKSIHNVKPFPLVALLALVAALVVAGCGSSSNSSSNDTVSSTASKGATQSTAAAPVSTVDATLNEWSISTNAATAKAGKVTFDAKNDGTMPHEMVVLKTDTPAGDLKVSGGRVSEKDSVGEVSDVNAGKSKSATLDLKPGKYVLVCNIPGHYQQGMYKALTVK